MSTHVQRTTSILMTAAILALGAGLGCDAEDPADLEGPIALRPGGDGGWNLNTSKANDEHLPSVKLTPPTNQGLNLNLNNADAQAYHLTSADLDVNGATITLDGIDLVDGELHGWRGKSQFAGDQFDGAALHFTSLAHGALTLRVEHLLDASGGPLYVLAAEVQGSDPVKLCAPDPDAGNAYGAYLLPIDVDDAANIFASPETMYIACTSGAIGKARQWGYDPEDIGVSAFETVIRAIRADYCGDGSSHTLVGTPIRIKDAFGVSSPYTGDAELEAGWTEDGAACHGTGLRIFAYPPSCFYATPTCNKSNFDVMTYVPNP